MIEVDSIKEYLHVFTNHNDCNIHIIEEWIEVNPISYRRHTKMRENYNYYSITLINNEFDIPIQFNLVEDLKQQPLDFTKKKIDLVYDAKKLANIGITFRSQIRDIAPNFLEKLDTIPHDILNCISYLEQIS